MLTAFIAIIKDSFRAAMASRVLYALLGLITLVLVVLAPLHTRESVEWKISARQHFPDEVALALKLHRGSLPEAPADLQRLWNGLSKKTQEAVEKVATAPQPNDPALLNAPAGDGSPFPLMLQLMNGMENDLNEMLAEGSLYEEGLWGKRLGDEAKELVDAGPDRLTRIQRRRLNRLLISPALAPELVAPGGTALEVWYGPWNWEFLTTSVSRSQFNRGLAETVSWIFDKFVMSVGLFIAILVTSSLIPEMFEPGSLNLLLSKPVPRWLLLMGKFVGGCAFIALCAAYLFLGTWLWMGLAAGLWDRGLLWSIPLYILVFAVYFSVSMLVGIWYRSAIVSVILAVVFWAVCFAVGATWGVFNARVQNDRIVSAFEADGKILATDCKQRVLVWNPARRVWDEEVGMNFAIPEQEIGIEFVQFLQKLPAGPTLGPVSAGDGGVSLVGTPASFDPEGGSSGGSWKLYALRTAGDTSVVDLGMLPADTVAMVQGAEGPVVLSSSGVIQRLDRQKLQEQLQADPAEKKPGAASDLFAAVGPDQLLAVRGNRRVAAIPAKGEILVLNRNTLARHVWNAGQGQYQQKGRVELPSGSPERSMASWLAGGGDTSVAAWGNGVLSFVDNVSMTETCSLRPRTDVAIEQLALAPDGRTLLVLYRDGRILKFRRGETWQEEPMPVRGAGDITGLDWVAADRVLVCHGIDRVGELNPASGEIRSLVVPQHGVLHRMYDWVINPFYQLAPKPGEFYKLVTHLSASASAVADRESDLTRVEYRPSPWSPLWSGLGFMAVILGISGWIFSRGEY